MVASSSDWQIRKSLNLSLSTYVTNYTESFVALDTFVIEKNNFHFYNAKNELIFSSNSAIVSAYDESVVVSAYNFFNRESYRLNFTGLYKTKRKGEFVLFGFDSGTSSNKLKLRPAIKLGYINTLNIIPKLYFSFGFSAWYGGAR